MQFKISGRMVFLFVCALFFVQCTSELDSNLEDAKFALDDGDYATAIASATKALDADSDNVEAARVLASGYMGRGGFDMHEIVVRLLELDELEQNNYRALADVLPADGDVGDMKLAIETLQAVPGIDDAVLDANSLKDAAYDLGMAEMLYHYAIAIYKTGYKDDEENFDVFLLDQDDSDGFDDLSEATTALVNFDNHLLAAGFDIDNNAQFIDDVRQTHCMLQNISSDEGYSLITFQAFVLCNLSDDSENEHPEAIDPEFTDCSLSNPDTASDAAQACFGSDTVIE